MMVGSTKVTVPAIKWAANDYKLTFQLTEVLSDYLSFRKGIWPGVGYRVTSTSKIKCCQDIAKRFFSKHEVYGPYVQNKRESIQAYGKSVKHKVQKMGTTWKAAYKMLQITCCGLDHEDDIWPTPAGNKLRDIWKEMKTKYPYFYELKPFVQERLTATDKAIGNSKDSIDSSEILRYRQAENDDRNQGALFDNEEENSLGIQDNAAVISDNEENPNILDPRLKKSTSSGQARYGYTYLLKFKCNELIF